MPRPCRFRRFLLSGTVVWASLALPASPLQATTARLASLGGGDVLEDDHNVQRWYGSLGDFTNQLTLEGGHFTLPEGWHDERGFRVSGPGLDIRKSLDRAGRWGTVAFSLHARGDDIDPGSLVRDRMGRTWSVMWSRRVGSVQPTVMVRHGSDEDEDAPAPGSFPSLRRRWDRARTEFGLGLRWDLADGAYLDLAGELRRHREQTTVSDSVLTVIGTENTGSGSFGLRSRVFLRLGEATALVPVLAFLHEDRPLNAPSPIEDLSLDGRQVKVGVGLNWYPDPDHFLVASLDYIDADSDNLVAEPGREPEVQSSRRWQSLSLTAGFETRFRYWLTFRGSFRYEPVDLNTSLAPATDKFATFMVNLGAAIQLGKYDLDLALTDQEPRSVAGYYGHSLFGNSATWLTLSARQTW